MWRRGSGESDEERQRREASEQALERGGIPLVAQERLAALRESGGLFSSDLSVSEFLLARQAGIEPLTQVMGSSVYHVGYQYIPTTMFGMGATFELDAMSEALNSARGLALRRLGLEAAQAGANLVLGVHIRRVEFDWAQNLIEFTAIGTAARASRLPDGQPALTTLSGQDVWKLHEAGYEPAGVVGGSTVVYVMAGWQTRTLTSSFGSWYNAELTDFTRGVYAARGLAMTRVSDDARRVGANGVVGVTIERSEREYEVRGGGAERTDLILTFQVLGTAIRHDGTETTPPVRTVLNL